MENVNIFTWADVTNTFFFTQEQVMVKPFIFVASVFSGDSGSPQQS